MSEHLQKSEVAPAVHRIRRRLIHSSVDVHSSAGRSTSDAVIVGGRPLLRCWSGASSTPAVRRQLPTLRVSVADKQRFSDLRKRTLSMDSIDAAEESYRRLNIDGPAPPSSSPVPPSTPPKSPSLTSTNVDEKSPVPVRKCSTPTLATCGRSRTDPGGGETESSSQERLSPSLGTRQGGKMVEGMQQSPLHKRSSPDMRYYTASPTSSTIGKRDVARTKTSAPQESLADVVGLTPYQQRLLIQTWPNIYGTGGASFGLSVYNALCNNNGNAKTLMQKVGNSAVFFFIRTHNEKF